MEALLVRHLFVFSFSFLLALYIIPVIMRAAKKFNILDQPDGKIKCHKEPIPYLGGVAIFIAFIATLALAFPFENKILWFLLGTTFLLFIGLIDDLHVLRPGQKFLGQVIAVLCFLKGGFSLKSVFFSSFVNMIYSGFWMLSVINAFNLVDVMDGLATLIAFMGGLTFLVIALYLHCFSVSLLLLAFLGPLGAFFIYNKPSAKIYLGDAGSMFIGGFLAATPLLLPWSQQSLDAYYTPVVILAVPLLEVFALVIIRSWLGIPFYYGSPHHFSIYLQRKGWSKSNVLGFTGIMCLCFSLLACLFLTNNISFIALVLGCMGIVGLWFFMVFYKKESGVIHNNILCFFKRS